MNLLKGIFGKKDTPKIGHLDDGGIYGGKIMTAESAKKKIKGSYGEGFVIMGTDRVEVSPDGKNVTADAKDGFEVNDAADGAPAQGISISADCNTVVLNGVTIKRTADGHLVISAPGGTVKQSAPKIGDEMEDGTILAGYYEGKAMYATPKDAPGTYTFNEAARYAKKLHANGHHDFRAPSNGEMNVLWENRNKGKLKGTFNETDSTRGWYWSSSPNGYSNGWAKIFSDGNQNGSYGYIGASLRCVR